MQVQELARVAALHEYRVLDEPADAELDAVVRVAAAVAGVPTATLNLIDQYRQCQLTTVGFDGSDSARSESMCALVFERGHVTHVPDAREDDLFAANPWVTGVHGRVRFYASAPLVSPQGYALGTLCVFDTEPGSLDAGQLARLEDLAQIVVGLFERRRQARRNAELAERNAEQSARLSATAAELERSNRDLEQYAAVASHDLAAPLATVSSYLELLTDEYHAVLDDQAIGWIGRATRSVRRMRSLIDSLLSHASAGRGDHDHRTADMDRILGDVEHDLHSLITRAGATVEHAEPLPVVPGDATLLHQLLANLVGNAIKYRHADRPCRIDISATPDATGATWTFHVCDNGRGIPAHQRTDVFTMYATGSADEAARAEHGGGRGIGLATCRRIVQSHGGTIWAIGTPGGGATICFTLPATPPPGHARPVPEQATTSDQLDRALDGR